jgi:RNA polymerase sigma-70 factor (ECF subfamily)
MPKADHKQLRFESLVRRFSPDLYRYAVWLNGDKSTAEDLVQETFMRAWRALDTLKDEASTKSWLFTILRRENARLYERERPETGQIDTSRLVDPTRFDTSTEAFVLRRALAELALEYREPLVLQVIGGFSCDEIADLLGLSSSAVMTRIFRARRKMQEMLAPPGRPLREKRA